MKVQMLADDPAGVEKVANILGLELKEDDDENNINVLSDITGLKTAWAACRKLRSATS